MSRPKKFPQHVLDGVKQALKESEERVGLIPYTNARDMIVQAREEYALTSTMIETMLERKEAFLKGDAISRPWSEIKKKYEDK